MEKALALQMRGITKRFGSVVANDHVDLDVYRGEILAILGENGCGKTTLMNMISGIYFPDEGQIFVDGQEVVIRSPKDAFRHRIGMIHQHFKLVDLFTAGENIVLGVEEEGRYNLKSVNAEVAKLADKYGFRIDLQIKNRQGLEDELDQCDQLCAKQHFVILLVCKEDILLVVEEIPKQGRVQQDSVRGVRIPEGKGRFPEDARDETEHDHASCQDDGSDDPIQASLQATISRMDCSSRLKCGL